MAQRGCAQPGSVLRVKWFFFSLLTLPSIPFPPRITKSEQGGLVYCAGSLFPPPALAADLLLMNKVAWGCHLPRGVSSPCTIGLIFWVFLCNLHVQPCLWVLLVLSMLSLEKILNRKGFQQKGCVCFPLPGRKRVKQFLILILCDGEVQRGGIAPSLSIYPTHTLRTGNLLLKQLGRKWEVNKGKGSFMCCECDCGICCSGQSFPAVNLAGQLDVTQICLSSKQSVCTMPCDWAGSTCTLCCAETQKFLC